MSSNMPSSCQKSSFLWKLKLRQTVQTDAISDISFVPPLIYCFYCGPSAICDDAATNNKSPNVKRREIINRSRKELSLFASICTFSFLCIVASGLTMKEFRKNNTVQKLVNYYIFNIRLSSHSSDFSWEQA